MEYAQIPSYQNRSIAYSPTMESQMGTVPLYTPDYTTMQMSPHMSMYPPNKMPQMPQMPRGPMMPQMPNMPRGGQRRPQMMSRR